MLRLLFSVITVSACLNPINLPDFESAYVRDTPLADNLNLDGVQTSGSMSTGEFSPTNSGASYGTLTFNELTYTLNSISAKRTSENTIDGAATSVELQFNFDNNLQVSVFCNNDDNAASGIWNEFRTIDLISSGTQSLSSLETFFEEEVDTGKYFVYDGGEGCDNTYIFIADICKVDSAFTNGLTVVVPAVVYNATLPMDGQDGTQVTEPPTWGYPEDAMWGDVSAGGSETCLTGESQSPVDIPNTDQAYGYAEEGLIALTNYVAAATTGVDDRGLSFTGAWGDFDGDDLQEIRLHTGSEHTLNGVQYDLEVQFIHGSSAISVLCTAADLASSDPKTTFFTTLQTALLISWDLNPDDLFTAQDIDTKLYVSYEGSLTQPPCTEGMTWYVMVDTCEVPQSFMNKLADYDSMTNNFRAVQEYTPEFYGYGFCVIGENQSPIDLPSLELKERADLKDEMSYVSGKLNCEEESTGLRWYPVDGETLGTFKDQSVTFVEILTPSEHQIGGVSYDAEVQVHHADSTVLSILFNRDDNLENDSVFDALQTTALGVSVNADLNDLVDLVNTINYFNYMGSLTENPCTENVEYYVVAEIGSMSGKFLDYLATKDNQVNNNRELQMNSNGVFGVFTQPPTVAPTSAPTITKTTRDPLSFVDSDDGTSQNEALGFIFIVIGIIVVVLLLYVLFEYTISQQRSEYQEVKRKKEQIELKSLKTLSPQAYMKRFDSDISRTL